MTTALSLGTAGAAILYNPIVTCFGAVTTTGAYYVTTAIDLYSNSVASQAARSARSPTTTIFPTGLAW